jgi:hypothetical protein
VATNNAKSATPGGKVSGDAISQHKKMAMGTMPKVLSGKKTPA